LFSTRAPPMIQLIASVAGGRKKAASACP
jgi:hypothetical protein